MQNRLEAYQNRTDSDMPQNPQRRKYIKNGTRILAGYAIVDTAWGAIFNDLGKFQEIRDKKKTAQPNTTVEGSEGIDKEKRRLLGKLAIDGTALIGGNYSLWKGFKYFFSEARDSNS